MTRNDLLLPGNALLQPNEIDLREIVAILRRQKRLIILTTVLIVALAFAYLMTATPIYQATVLVQIETTNSNLLDPNTGNGVQSNIINSKVDSEVEILRSAATALAVVEQGDLVRDPEFGPQLGWREKLGLALGIDLSGKRLRQMVGMSPAPEPTGEAIVNSTLRKLQSVMEVRRRGQTFLIEVSISSQDPVRAAKLANTAAQVYIDRQIASKTQSTVAARDVLSRQLETAQTELAGSEAALNGFIENNLARLEAESGSADVAALRRSLEQAKSEQQKQRGTLDVVQGAAARGDWESVAQGLGDTALAELARQRSTLQRQLTAAAQGSQEEVDLRAALAQIEGDLTTQSDAALSGLRDQVKSLADQEATARDSLRQTLLQTDFSSGLLTDLFNLQQSANVARSQYQQLLSRVQDFGALANIQIADAKIASEALPPNSAAFPQKRLVLMLSVLIGLALGTGLALLTEYYVGGVTSASQLSNILQCRVPVTVPSLPPSKDLGVFSDQVITAPMSPYAETFRKLRAATDMALRDFEVAAGPQKGGKVILVCSALPAEGKSTTALSLARTYAAGGRDTLLIDLDLRKPVLDKYLGMASEPGMLAYLREDDTDRAMTIAPAYDPLSSLMVVTAGGRSTEPTDQLLNSARFKSVLAAARDGYDIIVLDSPPLLPVVDTRYLGQYADVVLQVVRYSATTQGEAREASQQISEMLRPHVQILGVLSHESGAQNKSRYYSGHYSGYYGQDSQ